MTGAAGVQVDMVLCVIFGCSKRSGRDKDVSFYRIPAVVSRKGPEVYALTKRRRTGYLQAISRMRLTESIVKNDRVCSRHFHSGKPADLFDDTNPDWLPSVNLGYSKRQAAATAGSTCRLERRKSREANKEAQSLLELATTNETDNCTETNVPLTIPQCKMLVHKLIWLWMLV